ncbi:MAG: nitroreductase family protein [Bacteroidales bacterium]|nr:nitroreductase family protein [Bacteroidales bacterium]
MKRIFTLFAAALVAAAAACSCSNAPVAADGGNAAVENMMSRKSVRSFTDQKLTPEQIETLLRCAMAAPSGSNIQPWSFVVLQDKSRYEKIFEGNFNLRVFNQAAAVFVLCADTTVTRQPRDGQGAPVTMPNGTWRDDMGAVTENLLLAAESMGLGAVWTAGYPYKDRYMTVKKELGLPDNVLPYCMVPVGYPAGDDQPKDKWKPERIHYENW